MAFTNVGAVEYAKAMLGLPYWYGTFGQIGSKSLYKQKKSQYPAQYPPNKWTEESFVKQFGKKVHDCAGLAWKGFLMTPTGASNYPYNAAVYNSKYDLSANGMMEYATEKGNIGTMPEIIGLLVWKNNHVGIYAGKGADGKRYVYEAQGHAHGITKTVLEERNWQMWIKCPFFEYVKEPNPDPKDFDTVSILMPILHQGDVCNQVGLLQLLLNDLGFRDDSGSELKIDNHYGQRTFEAVCRMQEKYNLGADGTVGLGTWSTLLSLRFT